MRLACIHCVLFAMLVALTGGSNAADNANSQSAKRAAKLAGVLRCLVCQNQSIADSNAPLARDLKAQIRDQITQGRSDAEILEYMVARYGDFVLYKPPMKQTTWILWAGPFLMLIAGLIALTIRLSGSRRERESDLGAHDIEQAVRLLGIGRDASGT